MGTVGYRRDVSTQHLAELGAFMHEPVTSRPWNRSQHWQQDHAAYNNKSSRKQKAYLQAPNSGKNAQTRLCTFAPDTYENCNGEALGDDESLAKHPRSAIATAPPPALSSSNECRSPTGSSAWAQIRSKGLLRAGLLDPIKHGQCAFRDSICLHGACSSKHPCAMAPEAQLIQASALLSTTFSMS